MAFFVAFRRNKYNFWVIDRILYLPMIEQLIEAALWPPFAKKREYTRGHSSPNLGRKKSSVG